MEKVSWIGREWNKNVVLSPNLFITTYFSHKFKNKRLHSQLKCSLLFIVQEPFCLDEYTHLAYLAYPTA